MATRSFPKDLLRKILWGETPGKVHDQITDNGRWSIHHKMIFKAKDGLHYQTHYSVGATEYQDETPFEYDPVQIECEQVEQVEKTVLVWKPVKLTPVHLEEPMSLKQTLLNENKELKARVDALETRLHEIGDIAHDKSTGPAVNDCYWDIRELAYDLL